MKHTLVVALGGSLLCISASAAIPASEADRLGRDLTPMGAERAGTPDGIIPAWTGKAYFSPEQLNISRATLDSLRRSKPAELTALLAGRLANESPRVVITRANLAQHAGNLTDGHKALLQRHPDYRMPVYATVRNAFVPEAITVATRQQAVSTTLEATDAIRGASAGTPFPLPSTGAEVIWNHKLRYRGSQLRVFTQSASVSESGDATPVSSVTDLRFMLSAPKAAEESNGLLLQALSRTLAPARLAGQATLVHEPITGERAVWIYDPGRSRVMRAPGVGFDAPVSSAAGLLYSDQIDGFNGPMERYAWTLVGKRAVYIPYNSYRLQSPALTLADVLGKGSLNSAHTRYELHRVWVVDATLKPDQRHPIRKRRFYVDEDTWRISAVDCYDAQDALVRFQETHLAMLPYLSVASGPEVTHDLASGRYYVSGLSNESDVPDWTIDFKNGHFLPQNLGKGGL